MRTVAMLILCCILATCSKKQVSVIIEPVKEKPPVEVPRKPLILASKKATPEPVQAALQPITVYFDLNSHKIKPSEEVRLQEAAIAAGSKTVTIKGYACPIGTDLYNLELSRRRAEEVAAFFENHSAMGYGETDLVSRETSEYWKNRRVTVGVE